MIELNRKEVSYIKNEFREKGIPLGKISEDTGIPLRDLVVFINSKSWSKRIRFDIEDKTFESLWHELYTIKQYPIAYIAELFGRTNLSVSNALSHWGIETRNGRTSRRYNYDYFNDLNSEKKALLMGMFYSKIRWTNGAFRYFVPKEQIDLFNTLIVDLVPNYLSLGYSLVKYENRECVDFSIRDEVLCDIIHSVGITGRQYKNNIPDINEEFMPHFVRGFFTERDFMQENPVTGRPEFFIRSHNLGILEWIQDTLEIEGLKQSISITSEEISNYHTMYSDDIQAIEILYHYIYQDAIYYSEEKYREDTLKIIRYKDYYYLNQYKIDLEA